MTVDEALEALLDGDRAAREAAVETLRGQRFDLSRLVPILEHPHVSRQVKAIEVLRSVRSAEAVALLVPMLASPVWLVGEKAASVLGAIGSAAPELILHALDTATSDDHRLHVLDALSRLGDPRAREVLLVQADAWNAEHRKLALEYLRRYRDAPPLETIMAALHDPDAREQACKVAGRLQHPGFLAPLIALWLDDPQPPTAALDAIGKYGAEAIDPLLARAATAPRDRIAAAIERCLHAQDTRALFWSVLWRRGEAGVRDGCLAHLGTEYARAYPAVSRREAIDEHRRDPEIRRRRLCVQAYYWVARDGGEHGKHARNMLFTWRKDSELASDATAALTSLKQSGGG